MKSIKEQVDEFVEDWHDGSILFSMMEYKHTPTNMMWVTSQDTMSQTSMDQGVNFIVNNLKEYLIEKDGEEKNTLAFQIYASVLVLRGLGVIRNNPDSLKELNFYKQRYYDESKNNDDLRSKLKNAYDANDQLQQVVNNNVKGKESPTRG